MKDGGVGWNEAPPRASSRVESFLDKGGVMLTSYSQLQTLVSSRNSPYWTYGLDRYLKWAKSQKCLDAVTSRKVDEAIEKLRDQKRD